jgi:superfamily II DNA or RNA helicase
MLNEGIDVPDVGLVIFARVTHSRRIFVQQLGRGLRIKEGKERVHVLDFVADIRRLASGIQLNRIARRRAEIGIEFYRGRGANIVSFNQVNHDTFVNEYLADVADLDENDKIQLDFM